MLNKKGKLYDLLKKVKMSYYIIINFSIGVLLSAFKLFEYNVDSLDFSQFDDRYFPSEKYSYFYCNEPVSFMCNFFYVLQMINNVFNDLIFFLVAIIIDVALILNLRKSIRFKKIAINELKDLKHLKKMLVISGIIFIFSHLPELLIRLLFFILTNNYYVIDFCLSNFNCDKLNEFGEFFNFISIISQLFINLKFNKLCNESYQNFKIKLGFLFIKKYKIFRFKFS